MSQKNIDAAIRLYEAYNERDLDAFLALTHEEVLVESRLVAMEGGYRGHEGTRRWWSNILDVLPDHKVEVEQLRDLGEITLARLRARAHGAASDTPLDEVLWQPVRWRDGRVLWWRTFPTEEEALEAVGPGE